MMTAEMTSHQSPQLAGRGPGDAETHHPGTGDPGIGDPGTGDQGKGNLGTGDPETGRPRTRNKNVCGLPWFGKRF